MIDEKTLMSLIEKAVDRVLTKREKKAEPPIAKKRGRPPKNTREDGGILAVTAEEEASFLTPKREPAKKIKVMCEGACKQTMEVYPTQLIYLTDDKGKRYQGFICNECIAAKCPAAPKGG